MTNRFVCTKCRKNISETELIAAKAVRTRYDSKVHTYCPTCGNHIVSITDDVYNKCVINLSKRFMQFGCRLICYYEGEVEHSTNVIEYHPPIFRITDNEDRYFYTIMMRLKNLYGEELLGDTYVVDEEDGSFSVIVGVETWYFDTQSASNDRVLHLKLLKKIISALIKCGKKHYATIYRYE